MSQYIKKRKEFYSNYPHFWSDLYECEYSLFHVFPITEQTMKQLQVATERMGKIFLRLLDFFGMYLMNSFLNSVFQLQACLLLD